MTIVDNLSEPKSRPGIVLPVLFTLTIFASASLLFFVQPLFAKLVLPHIGGAAAVWTTAMLFFQVVLLGGYIYAHLLTKFLLLKWQISVHLIFWTVALFFLPLSVSEGWQYDPETSTTAQTLTLFAVGVGVPFGMLAANAPLLQSWYAGSAGPSAHDPYFLYGSSNFGSLLALLAFPLVAEPFLGAQSIGLAWSAVFILFGALLATSGLMALKFPRNDCPSERPASNPRQTARLSAQAIGKWTFLAFVPSSLMLAITTKISTDLGSFPLIWVVPLAIYILSFVVAFTNRPLIADRRMPGLAAAACAVMAVLMSSFGVGLPTWASALIFMPALFVLATFSHRVLYNARPASAQLTVFYISMSVGGALGGLFNSILAPALFDSLHEGWLSVFFATSVAAVGMKRPALRPIAFGVMIAGAALIAFSNVRDIAGGTISFAYLLLVLIGFYAFATMSMKHTPLAVCVAVSAFMVIDVISTREDYLFKDRSFFGTHTVFDEDELRVYANGTTIHGYQYRQAPGTKPTPLSYYYPESPMAQIVTRSEGIETARIGVVGLGVGSLACYRRPGQTWEFYEIDHMVDQVARTPALFNFMSECASDTKTHLGDARVVLAQQDLKFDIMVLDAYSSDSIPVHLVTVEAVKMYLDRLAQDGQLVFHISNRYYDLSQPLARIGRDLGLHSAIRVDRLSQTAPRGAKASVVLVMTKDANRIDKLLQDGKWTPLAPDAQAAWTDDRAHLLSALKSRRAP